MEKRNQGFINYWQVCDWEMWSISEFCLKESMETSLGMLGLNWVFILKCNSVIFSLWLKPHSTQAQELKEEGWRATSDFFLVTVSAFTCQPKFPSLPLFPVSPPNPFPLSPRLLLLHCFSLNTNRHHTDVSHPWRTKLQWD